MEQRNYQLYKGLQRPLVFKFFRGKFIYWAMGSIIAGVVFGGLLSALVSSLAGIIGLVAVAVPLMLFTISKQKQGLYAKKKETGIFINPPKINKATGEK